MLSLFAQSELSDLVEKVEMGERLEFDAGVRMMNSQDILALGYMANVVNEGKNVNRTHFVVCHHINQASTLSHEEVEEAARNAKQEDISEIHIVGGLNSELPFDYFIKMIQGVKYILPKVNIQAFTAVEIDYFTQITGLTVTTVLQRLKEAGLDLLSGGGAEAFSPRVEAKICEKKVLGERWLEIHETAHRLGLNTSATMLYGHLETTEERIDHLLRLRALQDRTGGFLTFIPLPVYPRYANLENNVGEENTTGFEDLKMLAISRILLDNFTHIKADLIMLGPKLAQVSLAFGVDDLETSQAISKRALIHMIQKAGRDAVERDTLNQRAEIRGQKGNTTI